MKTTKKQIKKELKKVSKLISKLSKKKVKRNQDNLEVLHVGVVDMKRMVKFFNKQENYVITDELQKQD